MPIGPASCLGRRHAVNTSTCMLVLGLVVATPSAAFADEREPTLIVPEIDPLPFATGGYGTQLGVRHPALRGVRIAAASFMVNVPDVAGQLGGNDGFHIKVRPSAALYILYYLNGPGEDGFAFGGALRYLRFRYTHDAEPGVQAETAELTPEAIAAYQWHPFKNGFYLQPWVGFSVTVARDGEPVVGAQTFDPLPIQPFFTVNVGWELRL